MVIGIEQTALAVFVAFWLVCCLEIRRILYGLVKKVKLYCIYKFLTHYLSLAIVFILKIFLNFRKFQRRYCHKTYSYKK